MDSSRELPPIPLQRQITVIETTQSESVTVPESLLDGIAAWQSIKDDSLAWQVGKNIASRMNDLYPKERKSNAE